MTTTIMTNDGENEVDVSLPEKRLVEAYAEFMERETPKIVEEYIMYKNGDGEVPLGDRPMSIDNWVRERVRIDDAYVCDVCDQVRQHAYEHDGEMVCQRCREDDLREPMATVKHSEIRRPLRIGSYENETEYELDDGFETEWVSTDAWRGYVKVSAQGDWQLVESKNVLTAWNDRDVKELDEELKELASHFNVEWARVMSRTSNVFSNNFDFYVRGSESEEFLEEVKSSL